MVVGIRVGRRRYTSRRGRQAWQRSGGQHFVRSVNGERKAHLFRVVLLLMFRRARILFIAPPNRLSHFILEHLQITARR